MFAGGKRPDRADIRSFADAQRAVSVSYDPMVGAPLHLVSADGEQVGSQPEAQHESEDTLWLELLYNGLTFDLQGLAPGPGYDFPQIEHRFDLDKKNSAFRCDAMRLIPGQHLVSGQATMPVVKGMIALARDLTHQFDDLAGVVWPPSASAIGRQFFESVSTAWLEGGAFPALGLTAFRETIDGAMQSVGLDFWIGQELRIEPPLSNDRVAATRLGVRLVNQLVLVGGLEQSERITAPDGTLLVMRPSRNGKFVRVWRE
ncbi:MAG: hypothetical protein AAF494_02480 [Pseudomonadota bacterium]